MTGVACAALVVPAALAAVASPASAASRHDIPADQPSYTKSAPSTPVASATTVDFRVDLPLRNAAAANSYVRAVSSPGSASYGHYLTPAQFTSTYGPTQATVDTVTGFLKSQGLTVTAVRPSRTTISVTGTAAQIQQAFKAALRSYDTAGSGELMAAAGPLSAPANIASLVSGVRGLSEAQHLVTPASSKGTDVPGSTQSPTRQDPSKVPAGRAGRNAPPSPGFLNAGPCSAYYGEKVATGTPAVDGQVPTYVPCGYTPDQVQSAYGVKAAVHGRFPVDGRGTTVAITDAYNSPTAFSDLSTYSKKHGLPALRPGQYTALTPAAGYRYGYDDTVNGDQCGEQGWYGEQTLDLEAVHGIAPGANILYVASRSCDNPDFGDALATIVDGHLADAISNSWGDTGEKISDVATFQNYQQTFLQAAIEGIGVYFSSGDSGDNTGADPTVAPTVDLPASNPLVTAVGGTSLAVGKNGEYLGEDGWGTGRSVLKNGAWTPTPPGTYLYGGGGGASSIFDQPFYQQGVVPDDLALKAGVGRKTRTIPDVSLVGDPNTGYVVGQTQTFLDGVRYSEYRLGGTSLSSPLMAGLVSIADQASGFHHGFLNPALYGLVGTDYVHDVSSTAVHYGVRNDYGSDPKTGISDPSTPIRTSLRSTNQLNTLSLRPGYDDVTGVGSPDGLAFLTHTGYPQP